MKTNKTALALILSALYLQGCGSGSTNENTNTEKTVNTGYFRDAAVSGVTYRTESQAGVTESAGRFQYKEGEKIKFSIGSLSLGEADAGPIVTPIEMTNLLYPSDTENVNMVRVLMALDKDKAPENGIQISERLRAYLSNDVDMSNIDITSDQGVNDISTLLSQYIDINIPSAQQAIEHFNETLRCNISGVYYGEYSGDDSGLFGVAIDPVGLRARGAVLSEQDDYVHIGILGKPLELKGGSQPLSIGSTNPDYDDIAKFSVNIGANIVSGTWHFDGVGSQGQVSGQKALEWERQGTIKYVGTYYQNTNEYFVPSGLIQITYNGEQDATINIFDFTDGIVRETTSENDNGNISFYLTDYSKLNLNLAERAGEVINETFDDEIGNDYRFKMSSCRL